MEVVEEDAELFEQTGIYESCYFCRHPTKFWHQKTNNPVCVACSKVKSENDLPDWYREGNR